MTNVITLGDYRPPVTIPAALRNAKTWLVWRLVHIPGDKKPKKIPYYASGKLREGGQGTPDDLDALVSYDRAVAAVVKGGYSGVGLAMVASNGLVALDFDACVNDAGEVDPRVLSIVEGTYAELSPSGTGVRVFYRGSLPDRKDLKAQKRGDVNLEVFHGSGYVTFTGNVLDGWSMWGWDEEVAELPAPVLALYEKRFGEGSSIGFMSDEDWLGTLAPKIGLTLEKARLMINALDEDCGYDDWLHAGQALHHEFEGSDAALELWREWSRKSAEKYPGDRVLDGKWSSFGRYAGQPITATWLLKHSKVARVAAKYEAKIEWQGKVLIADNERDLREEVCTGIAGDDRLGEIEREALAQLLKDRFATIGVKLPIATVRGLLAPPETLVPTVHQRRPLTEFGNAARMLDQFGKSLMYVPELDLWHVWTGVYWRATTSVEIEHYAKQTVLDMATKETDDHQDRGEFLNFCAESQQARMVRNMVALAASDPRVMVPAAELDKHVGLLCVQNGVVNLRTGELSKPDPKLRITRCCGCAYRPDAARGLFERTVSEVFFGDEEMAAFFQRVIGYTAFGEPNQDFLVIPHGNGSNGKSTVLGIIRKMFGSYARAAEAASFVSDGKGASGAGGAREDLVRLKGARFVYVNEPDENGELREGSVKAMTGGDAITARGVYGKASVEILPSWVVFMPTNHKPIVKGSDNGIWRRLMLLPFTRNFENDASIKKDEGLGEKLEREIEGVLAWCVEGARAYVAGGLSQPAGVRTARDAYRSQMDLLAEWLDDCCELSPEYHEDASRLWLSWESYAKDRGVLQYVRSSVSLGRRLDARFASSKASGRRVRLGLRLRDAGDSMGDAKDFFE